MQILSEQEIVRRITRQEPFAAVVDTGAFIIKLDRYIPAVCTAIHNGHAVDPRLAKKIKLSEEERRYEEDPYTGDMLASFPIVLQGNHSRYVYDLNRVPEECIYEEAWGKKVWNGALSRKERKDALSCHRSYYRVLDTLMTSLEQKYGCCVVYDLHSYNYKRLETEAPLFNIGTHYIDRDRFKPVLDQLEKRLGSAGFQNIDCRVAFDEVFRGKGYQAAYLHQKHGKSLCVPLEIKKVFMDEISGEPYPLILEALTEALKQAIGYNASYFSRRYAGKRIKRTKFFADEGDEILRQVDATLFQVAREVDTLLYINPVNLVQERKRFFARSHDFSPNFYYRQLKIDPFVFRKNLYDIPVDNIQDVSMRQLYRNTVDMLARKIDLLTTIGTDQFRYNSLRYYGEPREADIDLARFFISAPLLEERVEQRNLDAEACASAFRVATEGYGFDCRVELSSRIVARAMVNNVRRTIIINRHALFTPTEIRALIHHELGVHMVSTFNARKQPLKILRLGLPGNTETQEGLAILSEYLSGNLTLSRIKTLSHRVMAVHMMVQDYDFSRTFKVLTEDYGLSREAAFNLTARVYRGGGFTKDYLYLTGLRKILLLYQSGKSLETLFIGKTSMKFHDLLKEMVTRGILARPDYLPEAWSMDVKISPILQYLMRSVNN